MVQTGLVGMFMLYVSSLSRGNWENTNHRLTIECLHKYSYSSTDGWMWSSKEELIASKV